MGNLVFWVLADHRINRARRYGRFFSMGSYRELEKSHKVIYQLILNSLDDQTSSEHVDACHFSEEDRRLMERHPRDKHPSATCFCTISERCTCSNYEVLAPVADATPDWSNLMLVDRSQT